MSLFIAREGDQMVYKGPFQLKQFYDLVSAVTNERVASFPLLLTAFSHLIKKKKNKSSLTCLSNRDFVLIKI